MIEFSYVNHRSKWELHYFEFFVEFTAVNQISMAEIEEVYRADILLLESCGRTRPCLFQFRARIVCNRQICDYLILKYDKGLFEAMMTKQIKEYLDGRSTDAQVNEDLDFRVQDEGNAALFNPPEP